MIIKVFFLHFGTNLIEERIVYLEEDSLKAIFPQTIPYKSSKCTPTFHYYCIRQANMDGFFYLSIYSFFGSSRVLLLRF
jgi:hypothetical protein